MKITAIMTADPVSVPADSELDRAMALMDARGLRHLPVVEEAVVVGVVSDRDLLEATGWLYAENRRERLEPSDEGAVRSVRDVMRSPAITVDAEATVFDAAVRFVTDKVGCLPVLSGAKLAGIVTETDLLRAYESACAGDLVPSDHNPTVASAMTGAPVTVSWRSPFSEAVELARRTHVRHLPVVEGDALVGVVSDRDLRRARGRGRVEDTMMEEIMTRNVVTIAPDATLREAARILADRTISALPVVDGTDLVGILSVKDLVFQCMTHLGEPERSA